MKRQFTIAAATFGIACAAGLGLAGSAVAAPLTGTNAQDTVSQLRSQGYTVALNLEDGPRSVALSECTVTDVNGLRGDNSQGQPLTPAQLGTIYVGVNCPAYSDD